MAHVWSRTHPAPSSLYLYLYLSKLSSTPVARCARSQVALAGTRQKLAHGENGDMLHVWHGRSQS